MRRRRFIEGAIVAASGPLLRPVVALLAAGAPVPASAAQALEAAELALAGALAEVIIPATDTPGAIAAGVDGYIDQALALFFHEDERADYLQGLARFDAAAVRATGSPFLTASPSARTRFVHSLDAAAFGPGRDTSLGDYSDNLLRFYRLHKQLTITGYYTSEIGQTMELRVTPMGRFDADVPLADVGRAWA